MQMQLGYAPVNLHYDMCPAGTLASQSDSCEVLQDNVSDDTIVLLALPNPYLGAQVAAPSPAAWLRGYVMT